MTTANVVGVIAASVLGTLLFAGIVAFVAYAIRRREEERRETRALREALLQASAGMAAIPAQMRRLAEELEKSAVGLMKMTEQQLSANFGQLDKAAEKLAEAIEAAASASAPLATVPGLIEGTTRVAQTLVENITHIEAMVDVLRRGLLSPGSPESYIQMDEQQADKEYKIDQMMRAAGGKISRAEAEHRLAETDLWAAIGGQQR